MEDLLQIQIKENCQLALPEGLKDLMSDISREVLRYQPANLYQFIADYLSAMLVTRENLSVAGRICTDICKCSCQPELQYELRDLDVSEEDIQKVIEIIDNFFALDTNTVKEISIVLKLINKTSIDVDKMPAVQMAIRRAFLRHQANNTTRYESSSESEDDDMMHAAKHTLKVYRKTNPSEQIYESMAKKIQKSYRAYGVRRKIPPIDLKTPDIKLVTMHVEHPIVSPRMSYDIAFPKTLCSEQSISDGSWSEDQDFANMSQKRLATMSSSSLAGSYVFLPNQKPYSVHEEVHLSDLEEYPEREHVHIDYTEASPQFSMVFHEKSSFKRESKNISFCENVPVEAKMGLEVDDDSESKDSSMEADSYLFYQNTVKEIHSDHKDISIDRSDLIFDDDSMQGFDH